MSENTLIELVENVRGNSSMDVSPFEIGPEGFVSHTGGNVL
jgi:hypothetical protein